MATSKRTSRRRKQASRTDVARQAKDILLKRMAQSLRGGFLATLGLDLAPIVAVVPAEIPTLSVRAEQADLLFLLADDNIVHLEFQATSGNTDLKRFSRYNYAVSEHYDKRVYTVVLYGAGISSAPETLDRGSHVFTVRNVFIGQQDGEAVVAHLREKLSRGEALSEEDRTRIKLLPLMRHERPLQELLVEVAQMARALPREEREETIGMMVGLAYNYVDRVTAEQLLEVLRMANALEKLIEETLVKGINEGEARGEIRGEARGARRGYERAVRHAIELRFGQIPARLDQYLATADEATLEHLMDRIQTAASVEDLP